MDIVERRQDSVVLELTRDDLGIVCNPINEICHGPEAIEESEFTTRTGASRQEAEALLRAMRE